MMPVREIRAWLDSLLDEDTVGVDDGGLILKCWQSNAYLEVGGLPEEGADVEEKT